MARSTKTETVITCDLTGELLTEETVTQVTLIINEKGVTLDLGEKALKQFETAVSKFTTDHPMIPMPHPRTAGKPQSRFPNGYLKTVRAWATTQGITVPRVGVVPKTVLAQYEEAHA